MSTSIELATDFATITDALEAVVLRRRGSGAEESVTGALRRRLSEAEVAQSEGRYLAADLRWHLPATQLANPPEVGDRILDGQGGDFTILEVAPQTIDSRTVVVGRDLAIAHTLCARIDIQRATISLGTHGEQVVTWQDELPGIRARIQPTSTTLERSGDRQFMRTTHTIYLAEELTLDDLRRAIGPDGRVYDIVEYRGQDQIGALAELHVVHDAGNSI
ncbi:MAG: hypothetical protein DWQ31_15570 [Planctomycetota bacterium]|nr:MAG: hypothetical protein DWQ31_15570 [Planctomycetota bacterium]REJ94884.1 MAG: hypothetical protein DWQ35_07380 [Planctomycetota bacterium]REK42474.1 MAG: hypothetical protein DWQ46_13370 [Planctomycetota bacterium]